MNFYDRLQAETENERNYLLSSPIIHDAMSGTITLNQYVSFLEQAYHHVKHTVPLLMACGARLPEKYEWLRVAVGEYIEEETGHQEWILNDIATCGSDKEKVRANAPAPSTELMVSYAYDAINRINPICFFGMVHVLEGTSVTTATQAGEKIQQALQLPNQAFSYLFSHGSLDLEHIKFFENIVNKIDSVEDQNAIIHASKMFFGLYANIFRALPDQEAQYAA
jgi:pyrroloquinoline quinone (PQQ) biosynthesis protein C